MDDRPCDCEAAPSAKAGSLAGLIAATGRAARATSRTTLPFVDRGKEATDRYGVPWRAAATRMLAAVHATVIDGERWAAERLLFLAGRLAGDPSENERQALEADRGVVEGAGYRFRRPASPPSWSAASAQGVTASLPARVVGGWLARSEAPSGGDGPASAAACQGLRWGRTLAHQPNHALGRRQRLVSSPGSVLSHSGVPATHRNESNGQDVEQAHPADESGQHRQDQ